MWELSSLLWDRYHFSFLMIWKEMLINTIKSGSTVLLTADVFLLMADVFLLTADVFLLTADLFLLMADVLLA